MASKVVKKLYKTILKLSKNFDQNPGAKILVYRKSLSCSTQKDFILTSQYYNKILDQIFLPGKYIYYPISDVSSFTQITRKEFREKIDDMSIPDRTFVTFAVIRNFSTVWQRYHGTHLPSISKASFKGVVDISSSSNKTDVTSSSVSSKGTMEATLQNTLTPGTLLLSHPIIEGSLRRAVILVIQHNTKGSYGLVLNRQMSYQLKDSVAGLSKMMLKLFSHQNVSFGGNVRRLQYIHTIPNVGGVEIPFCSTDSTQKFYSGGDVEKVMDIIETFKNDRKSLQKFIQQNIMFFVGCCTWDVNQLQKEYENGFWIPVTTDTDKVLKESFRLQQYEDLVSDVDEGDESVLNNSFDGNNIAISNSDRGYNKEADEEEEFPKEFRTPTKNAHFTMMADISTSVNLQAEQEEKQRKARVERKLQKQAIYDKELKEFLAQAEIKDGVIYHIDIKDNDKEEGLKGEEGKYDDETASTITVKDINENNSNNNLNDDDEDDDEYDGDISNNTWEKLMSSLGEEYKPLAQLPLWMDTSKVTSVDWP